MNNNDNYDIGTHIISTINGIRKEYISLGNNIYTKLY